MKLKCLRCGYEWKSKVSNPRCCPNCHSYRWDKPKPADERREEK